MVLMESMVSGHQYTAIRERLADKLEVIRWDPFSKSHTTHTSIIYMLMINCVTVQKESVYKERKKIRSM